MPRKRKTPYQKIRDAWERGSGCRLTADECARLALDDAISRRAQLDDGEPTYRTSLDIDDHYRDEGGNSH